MESSSCSICMSQASGKTTLLSKLLSTSRSDHNDDSNGTESSPSILGADVTIDDQLGVYRKVPIELFLCDPWNPNIDLKPFESILHTQIFGKSLGQRIFSEENDEMRWVVQRITGQISAGDFKLKIQTLSQRQQDTRKRYYLLLSQDGKQDLDSEKDWTEILIMAVELGVENPPSTGLKSHTTTTADLFISEAIFKTYTVEGQNMESAVNRAVLQLNLLASNPSLLDPTACLAWGNTNTRPNDYVAALEAAMSSNRPIEFVPYAESDKDPGISTGLYLPYVGLEELFRRNVQRFIQTGRYIPCRAIIDSSLRVHVLMNDARKKILEHTRPIEKAESNIDGCIETSTTMCSKMDWNRAFAALAGYDVLDNGIVQKKIDVHNGTRNNEGNCDQMDTKRVKIA